MALSFEPIKLDGNYGDDEAALVMRSGRLLAVVSRLGPEHGEAAGSWFVEKAFGIASDCPHEPFADKAAMEAWLVSQTYPDTGPA
jgi:hypothetical protein